MEKIILFPVLLTAGCLVAGLYGALHNQISYTISPDYFHALKFDQFGIPEQLRGRVGASIVGWHASWWMGLLVGVPVLSLALIMPGWKAYLAKSLVAIALVAVTTLAVGLGGLLFASCTVPETGLRWIGYPAGVMDRAAFARAGIMHECSYLGGVVGVITAAIYLIIARRRLGNQRVLVEH